MIQNPVVFGGSYRQLAGTLDDLPAESKRNLQFSQENVEVIERIERLVARMERSTSAFARKIGWAPGTLIDVLRNKRQIKGDLIAAICKTYAIDPAWLLTGNEPPPAKPVPQPSEVTEPVDVAGEWRRNGARSRGIA